MELRLKFDEDELNYERYRPQYPEVLMKEVLQSFHLGPHRFWKSGLERDRQPSRF